MQRKPLLGELVGEAGEVKVDVCCPACGERAQNKGKKKKEIQHREGAVEVNRAYYYCPSCKQGVSPLDVERIGLVMGVAAAVDMSMFYPAGLVMDRFGRKFAYVPSFLLQALGMALIPLTGSFAALLAVTSLIGFGNGLGSGTMLTLGADLAPPKGVKAWARFWGCGG